MAAIVYYLAGLVGYLAKGLKAGGWRFEPDLIVGIAVPALAVLAFLAVRRARRHAAEERETSELNCMAHVHFPFPPSSARTR